MSITQQYSGIVLNQNAIPEDPTDTLALNGAGQPYFQTFLLPLDYVRGATTIPALTGFQVFLNVSDAASAAIVWEVARLDGSDWVVLANGASTTAVFTGAGWFSVFFDAPVSIQKSWLRDTFRIFLSGSGGAASLNYTVPNPLSTGQAFQGNTGNYPSPINLPNAANFPNAYSTALTDDGRPLSLMFRVLGATADSGTDYLGNVYRSAVVNSAVSEVTPGADTYWLSSPSPSYFAVQSLYLDERQNGNAVVVDRLTLDPLTPGVQFHVYYSSDPSGPGTDTASWDNLLWTPIYKSFQATNQQTFAFPEPIYAKYFKIEFTNLQSRRYDPGPFELPSSYNKHPKWILDYYLKTFGNRDLDLLSSSIDVVYDALDLAFTYYNGDVAQEPAAPSLSQNQPGLTPQYPQALSTADQADPQTLGQINYNFQPFTVPVGSLGDANSSLGSFVVSLAASNYSTESITKALGDTSVVSNVEREALLIEKAFPLMFFFLPCRHAYRVTQAVFSNGIAYYAGVKSLMLHRDIYTGNIDQSQYNEIVSDGANLLINDFID